LIFARRSAGIKLFIVVVSEIGRSEALMLLPLLFATELQAERAMSDATNPTAGSNFADV
jgi:hypothetical protein